MNYFKTALLTICLLSFIRLDAQVYPDSLNIDSLQRLLKSQKADTDKLKTLNALSNRFNQMSDYRRGMERANEALLLSKKLKNKKAEGDAYQNIANSFQNLNNQGGEEKADDHSPFKKYREKIDIRGIPPPGELSTLGPEIQKNVSEALKNMDSTLKIRQEAGDKKGTAEAYNSIGEIYSRQGNYNEALKNILLSIKGWEEIGKKDAIAKSYIDACLERASADDRLHQHARAGR